MRQSQYNLICWAHSIHLIDNRQTIFLFIRDNLLILNAFVTTTILIYRIFLK